MLDIHTTTCSSLSRGAALAEPVTTPNIKLGAYGRDGRRAGGQTESPNIYCGGSGAARAKWDRIGVDILRGRLDLLDGNDRALMEMYLEAGSSFRQMARLAGVNEVTVARRIRSMTRRLVNGRYLNCLRHRERLTAMELKVAKDYYLKALPIRRISARRGWSYYHTQRTIAKIRRLLGETIQPTRADL